MANTFKDLLATDAENILLNSSEFGVAVVHLSPDGTSETTVGVLDCDILDAGQPPPLHDNGAAIHQRAILELLPTITVVEEGPRGAYPSRFLIDSQLWLAVRVTARDDSTQSVEVRRVDQKTTKKR